MATSDATVPGSQIDITSMVISDGGANSKTIGFVKGGSLTWAVEMAPVVEVKHQALRTSPPTERKTGVGKVTGSFSAAVTSFAGTADETLYEVMTRTGLAAGWGNTCTGDTGRGRMVVTYATPSGMSQTATFAYVRFANPSIAYEDGIMMISAEFDDLEAAPTIA